MTEELNNNVKPNFYPAGYLVMTVTGILFLWGVTGLGAILINYWLTGVSSILNDFILFFWVAALAVVVPMHVLAYRQIRSSDKTEITTFSIRFAHGLLGAFLFVIVASNIIMSAWLGALLLNAMLGTGEFDKHLWAAVLSLAQAIAWFAYASNHFGKIRTNQASPKFYIAAVSSLGIVVMVLSIAFPALAYRDVARDLVKENDLAQINRSIADYVDEHEALPKNIQQLKGLDTDVSKRLGNYQYADKGSTKFGIFGYELCATFDRSKDKGRDIGFGFFSHAAGKQCFARTTISFDKLNQGLAQYAKNVQNGTAKLQLAIQNFLLGTKQAVDQEVTGVENFAGGQVKQLEGNLEGLEGGTTELSQQMKQLESNLSGLSGNLGGLQGDTGQLAQDFAAVEKFLHDLGCLFGGCSTSTSRAQ